MGGKVWMRLRAAMRNKKLCNSARSVWCGILLTAFSATAFAQVPYGPAPAAGVLPGGPGGIGVVPVVPPAPPAANIGAAQGAAAPAWFLTPSIEVGESYNDNVALAPKGQEVRDFITTISPGFTLVGQSPRVNLNLTYDPQELIFARGTFANTLQQRLLGIGRAEILREMLFFDANASISQEFVANANGGPATVGPTTLTTNNNLQTVQAAGGSPYLLEHLGPYANSETRYRFSQVTTSGNTIAPEQIQEALQRFTNGEFFGRLGWALTGDFTTISRGAAAADPLSGTTSKDEIVRADLKYPIYQALSAVGGVGYERISDPTLIAIPSGIIWNGGVQYQPNQYLLAQLTYGRRFDRSDVELDATYFPTPDLHAHLGYSMTAQTSLSALTGRVCAPGGIVTNCQTQQPIVPGSNTPNANSPFGLTSGTYLVKQLRFDFEAKRERNNYFATLYSTEQSGDTSIIAAERIIGGTLGAGRQLSPNLTLSASGSYYTAHFLDGSGRHDNSYTLSLGLAYTLSPTTTANVAISRFDTQSNFAADTLINDLVLATIRKQF